MITRVFLEHKVRCHSAGVEIPGRRKPRYSSCWLRAETRRVYKRRTSGPEAQAHFRRLTARMNSCPSRDYSNLSLSAVVQFGLRVARVKREIPSASLRAGSSLRLKNGCAQDDIRRVIVKPRLFFPNRRKRQMTSVTRKDCICRRFSRDYGTIETISESLTSLCHPQQRALPTPHLLLAQLLFARLQLLAPLSLPRLLLRLLLLLLLLEPWLLRRLPLHPFQRRSSWLRC
jgi:hypothetical protein